MQPQKPNKRRQERIRRKLPVALDLRGRSLGAITGNLSATGLLLHSSQMLLAGTALTGTLILDNVEVRFTALVRWSRAASRSTATDPAHSIGLEFLDPPSRAYTDYLKRALADIGTGSKPTVVDLPAPPARVPSRTLSSSGAKPAYPGDDAMPTEAGRSAPTIIEAPTQVLQHGPTQRTQAPARLAASDRATIQEIPIAFDGREEIATAEVHIAPRFGLMPGITGKAEAVTKTTQQRSSGVSPLAISAAATLFERAAIQAATSGLPPGSQTVAVGMEVKLVLPAQVRVGSKLEATATLLEVSADRVLRFGLELREGNRVVAAGEHRRLIANG